MKKLVTIKFTGEQGAGKTLLSKFLLDSLRETNLETRNEGDTIEVFLDEKDRRWLNEVTS